MAFIGLAVLAYKKQLESPDLVRLVLVSFIAFLGWYTLNENIDETLIAIVKLAQESNASNWTDGLTDAGKDQSELILLSTVMVLLSSTLNHLASFMTLNYSLANENMTGFGFIYTVNYGLVAQLMAAHLRPY